MQVQHTLYTSDLTWCFLFVNLKIHPTGKRFEEIEDIKRKPTSTGYIMIKGTLTIRGAD